MADMVVMQAEDAIQRPVSTAAPKWASDGIESESSGATTVGAQSGDGNDLPQSSDTITRWATAVSNQIKSSPSQSRMAVHNHTSIDDVVSERQMVFKVPMCCENCEEKVIKGVWEVPGVTGIEVDRLASRVAVFGEADLSRVLKKLMKVRKDSAAIFNKMWRGPVGRKPEGQQYQSRSNYHYELLQQSDSPGVQGKYAPYLQRSLVIGMPAIQPHNSNGQRDTSASSLTSSSNEPPPPSEEHLSLQQLRDGSDPSTVGASVGTTMTQDFSTQATTPGMGSGQDSQLESHEAAHEMNEPFKLEPNCGASSSRSLPPILQQSLKETAGGTTDLGKADTESEQIDIELEACVQQDGNGKQCKDETAGRQAQKLLSSIHQRLQGLKRAIGVIPTPADYVVEDHCVQQDSESVITFGWRVASEANALELLFQSKKGMSSILGVGVEFAKVLVVPASLEVKIIGIGQARWDELWQDSSNNKDDVIDIVSIAGVRRPGAKLENPSNIEYLTAKQSATKYGVGLENQSNTAHVNSTDVKPQGDCSCILDNVVEYLVLKKVIDVVVDEQCDGDGGQGSSSGVNGTKQDIGGRSSSQSTLSLLMSYFPLHGAQKPTGGSDDDDDDDETLPSRERPHQVNHKRPTGNFCRVTVHPGPGGSFDRAGTPQELGTTSIDPTLVFEFNYKLDMNGIICDKQIHITTTTAFDLGGAAPTELMSDSFGWYQNPLEVSLRNCGDAKLHSCQLKETLKETKISAKTTHTHSKNSTLQHAAQVQGGYKAFIQVTGSANKTTSNGETIAKEAASENSGSDVLKGFQYRDLRLSLNSLMKYRFYREPTDEVLNDLEERHKYLGMGMCEAVVPTCIGTWRITREDDNEFSPYLFDAERTLNRIFKVGQNIEREDFVQCYRVPIFVNHAMSHLCTLKDDHKLEGRKLSNVLEVGIVGI